jgi:hypothetical protein
VTLSQYLYSSILPSDHSFPNSPLRTTFQRISWTASRPRWITRVSADVYKLLMLTRSKILETYNLSVLSALILLSMRPRTPTIRSSRRPLRPSSHPQLQGRESFMPIRIFSRDDPNTLRRYWHRHFEKVLLISTFTIEIVGGPSIPSWWKRQTLSLSTGF